MVCDADEVIFDFMNSFETYLKSKNFYFNWASYALDGNIMDNNKRKIDKTQINSIINNFFKEYTTKMNLVKGAKISLNILAKSFNILILSNIPFKFYKKRKIALEKNGINFSFVANIGEKGRALKHIAKMFRKDIWFIDDSPYQVKSVKLLENRVNTILFVGNNKLEKLINNKKNCDYFSNTWEKNLKIILT